MAYCELSDVQSEFKNASFTADTMVKASEVEAWIIQSDALINSIIGKRYAVPVIGGDEALELLKLFSVTMTADRVRKKLEVVVGATQNAQQNPRGQVFSTKDVLEQLRQIAKGDLDLIGAGENTPGAGFAATEGFAVEPIFKKDQKQW